MRRTVATLALAATAALLTSAPASATAPETRGCQPTFDPVVGLTAAVAYIEEAWGRPLEGDEPAMARSMFAKIDRNGDTLICVKVASAAPAPFVPVIQGIDNRLPGQ